MKREASYNTGNGKLGFLLGIITFLAIIGIVIFVFALMLGRVGDVTAGTDTGNSSETNFLFTNGTGTDTSVSELKDIELQNVVVEGCYTP